MRVGTRVKVTEKNALQLLADYVQWKYGEDGVWQLEDQCTYNLDFDDENKVYKQILTWLMFERKDLQTGKTSVEEFVEKFVNKNNDLAKKILGMRNIITDTFLILKNKDNILIVEGSRRKKFMVQIFPEHSFMYAIGRSVEGRIYPWGDMYKFAGIVKLMKSSDEMLQETGLITPSLVTKWYEKKFKENAESININKSSSLQSILNKLPSELINAMCSSFHIKRAGKKRDKIKKIVTVLLSSKQLQGVINTLPKDVLEALELVKQNDGMMKYSDLVKKCGDDDFGFLWEKNPPQTPIGILRIHGLLIVGRMLKGERWYKTAIIPKEIFQNMNNQTI
jgi:hypothetical protein